MGKEMKGGMGAMKKGGIKTGTTTKYTGNLKGTLNVKLGRSDKGKSKLGMSRTK